MTTTHESPLVSDYLRRLERAAASLPREARLELVAELRGHVDNALLESGAGEDEIRTVLERLGPPEEIAAAAGAGAERRSGKLELAAMITLAIPLFGWLLGIVLVGASKVWTVREKAVALGLVLVPTSLFALGLLADGSGSGGQVPGDASPPATMPTETTQPSTVTEEREASADGGLGAIELVVVLGAFLAGSLAALYLASRLRRPDPSAEPATA